ncbi:alpha/beta hydrolase-fold protein [Deinococcus sp. MIMF12]|uniref:Alpha/beta hydrolase-fold protein n=1 Tax=Deinococcus rhizophilus TaxID=3049544 RepID=A0ABT7JG53_9DEIO|nr:alpha/beta hydrolase-fold protein [Deinococcus rhizophilus]MDL2344034.1 alpha/beta hydrolase-fold protein [Deinococcus rhizophilus]
MAVSVRGQQVTFIPPAGAAALVGDFTDWRKRAALPVVGGQSITLTLPRGAWVEYAWLDAQGKAFPDPDNAQKSLNPWWPYPRAAVVGEYVRHPVWHLPDATQKGTAHRLTWPGEVLPGTRRAIVYTPHGHDPARPTPVYYVQDGVAFYRTGRLGEVMDRAVEAGLASGAVLVFVEPGDRSAEYYLNDRYLDFLRGEVFPRVEGVHATASERGLWGASLGGLISLHLGSGHPELFSRVVSHSGAFIARPGATDPDGTIDTTTAGEWLRERLEASPPRHLRVSLDTGVLEWLTAPNRRMAASLADLGVGHQYREYPSGHNWVTWRDALPEAFLYMQGT